MNRLASIVGLCSAFTIAFVVGSREASAQTCVSQAPRYLLTSDTVEWSIQVASGQSCLRGLRFGNVVLQRVSLTAPPKSGNVQLVGPGFRYTANPGFHGEDSFTVEVLGFAGKARGTSTIHVAVSVKE
jgi:hypothetical protein